MRAVPFLVALLVAGAIAPVLRRAMIAGGHGRPNYRDRRLPFPFGVLIAASAALALLGLAPVQEFAGGVLYPQLSIVLPYALGAALLGLIDDTLAGPDRGLRGHAAALRRGELSTGVLKAAGLAGLALWVMSGRGLSALHYLLASAVLVLATHLFNLLDLRPGRTLKALVLLGAGLTIGTMNLRPLWTLGLLAAPALVAGVYDLRERVLLGDAGASTFGAIAGLWLVLSLGQTGQAIAAGVLAALTLFGELRSISEFVERAPLLRSLDSWGRP